MRFLGLSMLLPLLLASVLFAGDTIPLQKPSVDTDLSGIWEAHGVENDTPEGPQAYAAVVTIRKLGDGYLAQWSLGPGNAVLANLVREGDTVFVSWSQRNLPSMSLFKVSPCGKEMTGKWLAPPANRWQSESLRFLAPLPVPKKVESL